MKGKTISIALATYNGERYLPQQLLSYASQSRIPDQLVVCDDRSSDNTVNILKEFSSEAPFPVVVCVNDYNRGTGVSFSRALELCNGEIIAFSDQDDVWLPDKLLEIERAFIDKPHISYVISNAIVVDDCLNTLGYSLWHQRKFTDYWQHQFENGHELEVFLRLTVTTGMTTAIRSHLRRFGPPQPSSVNHDAWYIPLAAIYGHEGALIKKALVKYRQHAVQQYGAKETNSILRFKRAFTFNYESITRDIKMLEALRNYIQNSHVIPPALSMDLINDKMAHLKNRKLINEIRRPPRLLGVLEEVKNKRYFKYGSWKNILTDMLSLHLMH